MSSSEKQFDAASSKNVADVALAIATIVHIIKEQPAFDSALYDQRVQSILDQTEREISPILRAVLEISINLDNETPTTL